MAKKKAKKPKKEAKIVDPYNDDTPRAVTPKAPKVEKIKVTEVPLGPTNLELDLRLVITDRRLNELIDALSKSKSVKGI